MQKILITGITGFLGSSVLARLLELQQASNLLLLVRAGDAEVGLERISEALRNLEVPSEYLNLLTADQILLGDFSDTMAFLSDQRLDSVTEVINCAAVASFGKNPLIWPVNVDGTFAFAKRMANLPYLRRFLHVGTAMACGPLARSPVHESWEMPSEEAHLVDYTASKAEIEHKMRTELPTLPLVVARPSIVVGHTRLGCKPSGSIFWVFRMGQKLGHFTCELDEKIDVIPVDYCADVLVQLALKAELKYNLYHISAGELSSCSFRDIDIAMAKALDIEPAGPCYRQVAHEDLTELAHEFETLIGPCNRRLVLRALRLYGGFAELNFIFDNHRLLSEGIPASPKLTDYVAVCALTSNTIPIAKQMEWDFK